ncbi:MAG TPA: hypothetical protein VGT61_13820 [Thermomicrobiales bacterium]|jgi:hypothetical protein|nr:hypothetical protein [Thermomicrobiales bacterium]
MDADEAVLAALIDLRAMFPAMQVRTEHVLLGPDTTVFRATIALPSGAEATGYGGVAGTGLPAIAAAEHLALARAMAFLGIDPDTLDVPDDLGDQVPVAMSAPLAPTSVPDRRVAEEPPSDPFNLGTAPSPAAVAAATGMRLGARPNPDGPTVERSAPARPAARSADPSPVPAPAPAPERATSDQLERPAPPTRQEPGGGASTRPAADGAGDTDDDVAVSHQAFWRWAGERGLENRTDVEDLLGRSIGGLRPAAVRDLIIAAQEGVAPDDDEA